MTSSTSISMQILQGTGTALGVCALLACNWLAAGEVQVRYPADAGVINLRAAPYHAVGDGVHDDTAAIQQAIRANIDGGVILYLPDGVYRVTDRLEWRRADGGAPGYGDDAHGGWGANIILQGQSRSGTVIRLDQGSAGYGDAAQPKAVIYTASRDEFNQYDRSDGRGNQAFETAIRNLTVDVGSGNPGAIGIDFQVSNWGGLYDVLVQAGGAAVCGVLCTRADDGPGLLQRVEVTGFATGVEIANSPYSMTIDGLQVSGQGTTGVRVRGSPLAIADLSSANTVPAMTVSGLSLVNLLGGSCLDGGSAASAIRLIDASSYLVVRDLRQQGYGGLIQHATGNVTGSALGEWVSAPQLALARPARGALGLPVQTAPTYETDPSTWRFVGPPGGGQFSDDLPALQAAMDAGLPVVYLARGTYRLSDTLTIPATVRRIVGNEARIAITYTDNFSDASLQRPMLRIIGGTAQPLIINDVVMGASKPFAASEESGAIAITHASPRTLSVVHAVLGAATWSYTSEAGAGNLFLTDVVANLTLRSGQSAWCRQLDIETGNNRVRNAGGTLWILGLKAEKKVDATVLETTSGGRTELLGGTIYATGTVDSAPQFLVNEAQASLSFIDIVFQTAWRPSVPLREIVSGVARVPTTGQLSWAGLGLCVPLYSSRTLTAPAAPISGGSDPTRPVLSGTAGYRATIRILDGGVEIGTTQAAADGTWSWQPSAPLSAGIHQFSVVVVDLGLNTTPASSATAINTSGAPVPGPAAPASSGGGGGCGAGVAAGLLALLVISLGLRRRR